jgi:hypothetical protein
VKTFPQVLEDLFRTRYTGTITLHFFNGMPRKVELPAPVIELVREPIDKRDKVAEAVSV